MDKSFVIKIFLIAAFFIVFIAGIPITVKNYRRWSSVSTSVVKEYQRPAQTMQSSENKQIEGTDKAISNQQDSQINNDDPKNGSNDIQDSGSETSTDHDLQSTDDGSQVNQGTQDTNNGSSQEQGIQDPSNGSSQEQGILNPDEGAPKDQNINSSDNITEEQKSETEASDNNNQDYNERVDNTDKTEKENMEGFYISKITDDIFARISGKSYPENCTVPKDELRYVHIRHYGFEGEVRDGELIVNAAIAKDVLEIFEELYAVKYQIEKVRLIDEYGADDVRSMEDNNSSCFNYRTIAESSTLSNHAYGRAIDINPFYNPYVYTRSDGSLFLQPQGSEKYVDRTVDAACIIRNGDVCYNIFKKHGFSWGGDWNTKKDYQHFEKTD